jgi:hypothetical protein
MATVLGTDIEVSPVAGPNLLSAYMELSDEHHRHAHRLRAVVCHPPECALGIEPTNLVDYQLGLIRMAIPDLKEPNGRGQVLGGRRAYGYLHKLP